jgi:outer membrane protein assembly factor BamD
MRKLIIIVAVCMLLFSCASKGPKRIDSAGNLYVDGVNFLQAKKYSKAIDKFSTLRENHPFDPLAIVAAVKLGDTYFAQKEYIFATGVYEDFFKSHPDDENVPYVLSRLGECYDRESLTIDRDQDYTLKAIERLTYLKNRYPTNTYAKESEPRLAKMIQKLADRELYVGEFYYKSAQYNASIVRLEYFLAKYPNAKGIDKGLLYLAQSYREIGDQEKSDFYLNRLHTEYPKSLYARTTIRERKTLQPIKSEVTAKANVAKDTNPVPLYEEKKPRNIQLVAQTAKADQVVVTENAKEQTPVKNTEKTTENETIKDTGKGTEKDSGKGTTADATKNQKSVQNKENDKNKGLGFFDKKKPVDIVSDTMEGFDKEKYVLFKGSVIAKQEDLFIFADTVEAYMSEETNEIERAIAKGNVKIVKLDRTATCREALFENAKGEITLKGDVVVYQGKDKLSGDVIIYYVNEDRVVVQADKDKRTHVTVQPK